MGIGNAPIKTPDGQAELATRARQLSQRHRTLLLLVDGRRSEAQLRLLAERAGVPPSVYDELLDMGMITVPLPTLPIELAPHPTLPPLPVDVTLPSSYRLGEKLPTMLRQTRYFRSVELPSMLDPAGRPTPPKAKTDGSRGSTYRKSCPARAGRPLYLRRP